MSAIADVVTANGPVSQGQISAEIADLADEYRSGTADVAQPLLNYPPYRSSVLRYPLSELLPVDPEGVELAAPCFGERDGRGRPVRRQLVEVWQANASGRYRHMRDQHPAPLDPNFTGIGRCLTDDEGGYRFTTIKPGPYPWRNHHNAWRPAHVHFSLFGTDFTQRMITQMYFPGDPLFPLDPIYQSITDPGARARLVADYDHGVTTPEWATGYRWDIVLNGPACTPMES
jgi:protocatechuate 3,4-dioxygenase, beta subunit